MKGKDFFQKITKQAKINNEDFNKIIEALPDFDLGDIFPNLFDQEFLTRDRAASDPKIYDKIRAEQLDAVDAIIKDLVPFLSDKDKSDFQNETKTFNKLKFLKDAFGRTLEAAKSENPNNDEKVRELTKQTQEYVQKIAALQKQWETDKTELVKGFEEQKKTMQLDWTLDKKLGEYEFADVYNNPGKPFLIKSIVDKIKADNVLVLDDKGGIQVHEKTESGVTKQKFNGNDPVTLDKLLEEPLKPFLKKNNSAGSGTDVKQNGNGGGQGRTTTSQTLDRSKMTLRQLNASQLQ